MFIDIKPVTKLSLRKEGTSTFVVITCDELDEPMEAECTQKAIDNCQEGVDLLAEIGAAMMQETKATVQAKYVNALTTDENKTLITDAHVKDIKIDEIDFLSVTALTLLQAKDLIPKDKFERIKERVWMYSNHDADFVMEDGTFYHLPVRVSM